MSAVGHYKVAGDIPWLFFGYALMDFFLGVGFYTREKWTLPLTALNFGGYAILQAITLISTPFPDLMHMGVNIATAGSLWGVVYIARDQLAEGPWGRLQAASFTLLWALTYVSVFTSTLAPII